MAPLTLHLRSETKALEHRSALTPAVTRKLLEKGFKVNIAEIYGGRLYEIGY